jgi:hypothetical protein
VTRRPALAAVLGLTLASSAAAQTQLGTAFTYQGRLHQSGSPAEGSFDLRFTLHDAPAATGPVAPVLALEDVPVVAGLFTVTLDFGGAAFTGNAAGLEVAVRPGASTGAYTTVGVRQALTAAPNALFAVSSRTAPWAGITAKPAGFADDVDNDSGGDITGVTVGSGLTGGGTAGSVAVAVDFTGSSGAASAAARVDHHHLNQTWTGGGGIGFTVQNTGTAVSAETSGPTSALVGNATASSGILTSGVWGRSGSTAGRGVYGQSYATTGTPTGVYGSVSAPDGIGVYGAHLASTGTAAAVVGETSSTSSGAVAVLGEVSSTAPGGNSAAVRGINNGTGPLGIGVWGSHAGSGWGVNGTTVAGIGVRGVATASGGVGVRASGLAPTGIALEIVGGAIRVAGAGPGTTTPVFVHVISPANSCNGSETVFDHPLVNGDPDAILIVTSRAPMGFRLWYGTMCGISDRWGLYASAGFSSVSFASYNVLVIKP